MVLSGRSVIASHDAPGVEAYPQQGGVGMAWIVAPVLYAPPSSAESNSVNRGEEGVIPFPLGLYLYSASTTPRPN